MFKILLLISCFVLLAYSTRITENNSQQGLDSNFKEEAAQILFRHKRSWVDIALKLEKCCNIRLKNKNEKKELEAGASGNNCWNYLFEKIGGRKNYDKSNKDLVTGTYHCLMLCTDEKLGLLDSEKKIKKDAALKYILEHMFETERGKALARENFEICITKKGHHYKVVNDGSVTCSDGFRGLVRCIKQLTAMGCPDEEQVDGEECEEAREELARYAEKKGEDNEEE